jgi:phage tail-like protein
MAMLLITRPDGKQQQVELGHAPLSIGRAESNDLVLQHPKVSRLHAIIEPQGEGWVLIDQDSSNGTWVGEARLQPMQPHPLKPDLRYRIAIFEIQFVPAEKAAPPGPPEKRTTPPPEKPRPQPGPPKAPAKPKTKRRPKRKPAFEIPGPPTIPPTPPSSPANGYEEHNQAFGLGAESRRLLSYLPPIYHDSPFLARFLLAFEGLMAPLEQTADHFDLFLDPRTAPQSFLPTLASWLGLTLDEKWPAEKIRALLLAAPRLFRMRGTKDGLVEHLRIYSGLKAQIEEPDDRPHHFIVRLKTPKRHKLDRETLERIIEANRPAHTTYELILERGS